MTNSRATRKRIAARPKKTFVMKVPTVVHEMLINQEGYFLLIQDEVIVKVTRVFNTSPLMFTVEAAGSQIDIIEHYMYSGHYDFCYSTELNPLTGLKLNKLASAASLPQLCKAG